MTPRLQALLISTALEDDYIRDMEGTTYALLHYLFANEHDDLPEDCL